MRAGLFRLVLCAGLSLGAAAAAADDVYTTTRPTDGGIGKVYMGREIAYVMGHQGAFWLDRPGRDAEEGTALLVDNLPLSPGDHVADIGAGTGYFSLRIASRLSTGKVYAVDIQQEMLDLLAERAKTAKQGNVVGVLGTERDPNLPAGAIDLILMVDAYHEFAYPKEMGEAMVRALKPGGKIALVEYRAEDDSVPIKRAHKMTQAQAKREMAALGLSWVTTKDMLPWQHLMIFEKPKN
ncbi:MAG: class I SAM-dependent methyltransferase [Rhodospirillaceae bacterium]|nr:class I SAM-dependent methyltransferase [Rhodospirillaceae bacterium]